MGVPAAILSPLSREAGTPGSACKETLDSLAAKDDLMKRMLRNERERQPDETVATMLERYVRGREGSAAIKTGTNATLRTRLAASR